MALDRADTAWSTVGDLLEALSELGSADFGDRAVVVAMVCAFLTWPIAALVDLARGWW